MILMVQIGLLVRTTWALSDITPGFDPAQVLTFRVGLSGSRYEGPAAIERFTTDLLSRLRALPGVASAGIVDRLPVADREPLVRLAVEGTAPLPPEAAAHHRARRHRRRLSRHDEHSRPTRTGLLRVRSCPTPSPVALVNEEAARRFWPGRDPIGARLALDADTGQEVWLEVVGIVGNLRNSDIDQGPLPQVFVPASQQPSRESPSS